MACLAYNPSTVVYCGKEIDRIKLIHHKNEFVKQEWNQLLNAFPFENLQSMSMNIDDPLPSID